MNIERDWDDEMRRHAEPRFPIDHDTADRLLSGRLSPEDAPPGYAAVAGLICVATSAAAPEELAREAAIVAAGVEAVRSNPAPAPAGSGRRSRVTKLRSLKVAAIAAGAVLGSTGVAAAATGNLPAPAQTAVSDALSHVSVSVPKANGHANAAGHGKSGESHGQSGANGSNAADTSGNGDFGLCTAFLAAPNDHANARATSNTSSGKDDSTAFTKLMADHGGSVASTTTYCNGVVADHPSNA